MPDELMWESFFETEEVLKMLGLKAESPDVADLGCGYGTFSIPAARMIKGVVHALDIEPEMIEATRARAQSEQLVNLRPRQCDFISEGTGLTSGSVAYVMLFNILHTEHPLKLLGEAYRILGPGGKTGIIHWRYDSTTPRGPSMTIRPKPEQCREWAVEAGFHIHTEYIELPPYHYGIILEKG